MTDAAALHQGCGHQKKAMSLSADVNPSHLYTECAQVFGKFGHKILQRSHDFSLW